MENNDDDNDENEGETEEPKEQTNIPMETPARRRWRESVIRVQNQRYVHSAMNIVIDAFAPESKWLRGLRVGLTCALESFASTPVTQMAIAMKSNFARNRVLCFPTEVGAVDGIFARFTGPGRVLFRLADSEGWRGVFCGVGWRVLADVLLCSGAKRQTVEGSHTLLPRPASLAWTALCGLVAVPFQAYYYRSIMNATAGVGVVGERSSQHIPIAGLSWLLTPALAMVECIRASGVCAHVLFAPVTQLFGIADATIYATNVLGVGIDEGYWHRQGFRMILRGFGIDMSLLPYYVCAYGLASIVTDLLVGPSPYMEQRAMHEKVKSTLEEKRTARQSLQDAIATAQQNPLRIEVLCFAGLQRAAVGSVKLVRNLSQSSGESIPLMRNLSRTSSSGASRLWRAVSDRFLGTQPQGPNLSRESSTEVAQLQETHEQKLCKGLEEKRSRMLNTLKESFGVAHEASEPCDNWAIGDEIIVIHGSRHVAAVLQDIETWRQTVTVSYSHPAAAQLFSREIPISQVLHLGKKNRTIRVKRATLVRTALSEIGARSPTDLLKTVIGKPPPRIGGSILHAGFVVKFEGEEAQDYGGVRRELFDVLAQMLTMGPEASSSQAADTGSIFSHLRADVQLLELQQNRTLLPMPFDLEQARSNGSSRPAEELLEEHHGLLVALGRALALAAVYSCPCPVPLARVAYKLLVGAPISTSDIRCFDENVWKLRLEPLLLHGVSRVQQLWEEQYHVGPLTFVSIPTNKRAEIPLIEGGAEQEVTEARLEEYLSLVCEDFLVGSTRVELDCILRGFWQILPREVLQKANISADELQLLINGLSEIDIDSWKKHAVVEGTHRRVASWFFEIVQDMDSMQRSRVLAFATGASRLPPGGFVGLKSFDGRPSPFRISVGGSEDALPSAHTCFNQIVLPPVQNKEELEKRLKIAMNESSGMLIV